MSSRVIYVLFDATQTRSEAATLTWAKRQARLGELFSSESLMSWWAKVPLYLPNFEIIPIALIADIYF